MKINGDQIVFSTGTTEYANAGLISINDDLEIAYGYDGSFRADFTKEERRELAEFMIKLWQKYGDLKEKE